MNKECGFFEGKLPEYALNELENEPDLKARVAAHVASCENCWKTVDAYKKAMATAASVMKVDFPEEAWEVQRREIIRRITQGPAWPAKAVKFLRDFLSTRKLAAGFALLVALAGGAGAGYRYHTYQQELKAERTITSRIDLFENMEIIERLDFYRDLSEKRARL